MYLLQDVFQMIAIALVSISSWVASILRHPELSDPTGAMSKRTNSEIKNTRMSCIQVYKEVKGEQGRKITLRDVRGKFDGKRAKSISECGLQLFTSKQHTSSLRGSSRFSSKRLIQLEPIQTYNSTNTATTMKNFRFILSGRLDQSLPFLCVY